MRNEKTRKIVIAALFAALVYVATMIIKIPTPTNGYINLGDCIVLLAGFFLGPIWGGAAAGIGSCLADLISGYMVYAPATLVIKALVAISAYAVFRAMGKSFFGSIIGGIIGETVMVLGYFAFEWAMLMAGGSAPGAASIAAAAGIPMNLIQGAVGIVVSCALYFGIFKRLGKEF